MADGAFLSISPRRRHSLLKMSQQGLFLQHKTRSVGMTDPSRAGNGARTGVLFFARVKRSEVLDEHDQPNAQRKGDTTVRYL